MKKRAVLSFFILIAFICVSFTACKNPIIIKWWDEEAEYFALIKSVPQYVYETIIQETVVYEEVEKIILIKDPTIVIVEKPMPPEVLLQHIEIVNIEFVIFSGDQTNYNWAAKTTTGTYVTPQEQDTNNRIVTEIASDFETRSHGPDKDNDLFIILHGHANPVYNTPQEIQELQDLSLGRAKSVRDAIAQMYTNPSYSLPKATPADNTVTIPEMQSTHEMAGRMTVKGYGGGRNMSGASSSYAGLNRRVEVILFRITTDPVSVKEN